MSDKSIIMGALIAYKDNEGQQKEGWVMDKVRTIYPGHPQFMIGIDAYVVKVSGEPTDGRAVNVIYPGNIVKIYDHG